MRAGISFAMMAISLLGLGASGSGRAEPAHVPAPLGDPPPPLTDTAFDAAFRCPESLADDGHRRQALVDYFHWAQARHPNWSLADSVEFKKTLLVRHQCADSLRDLATFEKRAN